MSKKNIAVRKEERLERFKNVDIYPVITSDYTSGRPPLDILNEIAEGGAKIVQLREKNYTKGQLFNLALEYKKVCDRYGILLIINDHIDIALAVDADGVHLGQDDLPLEAAVTIAPEMLIGISTHSINEAITAERNGAGYINIGPIYPTQTKATTSPALGLDALKQIIPQINLPFTVMGGIKERHIPELIKCGAKKIAMVTEITMAEDVREKVKTLIQLF